MPYADPVKQKQAKARLYRSQKAIRYAIVNEYKSSGCYQCGESDTIALDLHHLDPVVKDINVSAMVTRLRPIEEIESELKKCVVICANCHRKLHRDERISAKFRG